MSAGKAPKNMISIMTRRLHRDVDRVPISAVSNHHSIEVHFLILFCICVGGGGLDVGGGGGHREVT